MLKKTSIMKITNKFRHILGIGLSAALFFPILSGCDKDSETTANVNTNGKSGSTARFTLQGDNLITLSGDYLVSYDVSNPAAGLARLDSEEVATRFWGQQAETVFPFGQYVLLGTPSGMQIFRNSSGQMEYLSTYDHVLSCDPVVAQGDYAYVTLRQGTRCNRGLNQMEVIDISNIEFPVMKSFTPMNIPFGLAVNGTDLFVCEESKLCQVNVSDPLFPRIVRRYDVKGYDCIYDRGRLIVVGPSGLVQYQLEGDRLTELSRIAATRTGG